jgi:hypothetical protein
MRLWPSRGKMEGQNNLASEWAIGPNLDGEKKKRFEYCNPKFVLTKYILNFSDFSMN